jgi:Fur family transcriptional regulator, stress-responsive regulator
MRTSDELTELYRANGRKMTAQRQRIFEVLQGNEAHPTAEVVYESARADMPTISLKTVYQTLNELAELGEIAALDLGTGSVRFDPNVETPHHHLVCRSCGKVRDLDVEFTGLTVSRRQAQGYDVASAEVVFRGRCDACQQMSATTTTSKKP